MKRYLLLLVTLFVSLSILGACGNGKDKKEYEEITTYFTKKLRSADRDVKIVVYENEAENQLFVEKNNSRLSSIDYYLWDKEKKHADHLDPQTQVAKDYKEKYMEKGEKVFETTIDYDNKEKK